MVAVATVEFEQLACRLGEVCEVGEDARLDRVGLGCVGSVRWRRVELDLVG